MQLVNEKRTRAISALDKTLPLYQKVLKVSEESGELSQAFLAMDKSKNVSKSAHSDTPELKVMEEACDVINCALDVIYSILEEHPHLSKEVKDLYERKLDKWEAKHIKMEPSDKEVGC